MPRGESRLGRLLGGRWRLESVLGSGGWSCVYAARHTNGRAAAVKVLHDHLAAHPQIRRRFLAEGYIANKIGHPGAVTVLDDGQDADGTTFLVMERLSGESLATRLQRNGPFEVTDAVSAMVHVLDVLAAAHDRGIVHRDVKPSNVLRTDEGIVKLLDFGTAQLPDDEDFITRTDSTWGTPAFMSPELATGHAEHIDPRTDIWAVGATLFQLLSGRVVHDARGGRDAIVAAATRRAPSLHTVCPELPEGLRAVVDRALHFDKNDRWPNARAMRAALAPFGAGERGSHSVADPDGLATESAAIPARQHAPKRSRPFRVVLALVAALVIFGLAAFGWNRGQHSQAATPVISRTERDAPPLPAAVRAIPVETVRPNPEPPPAAMEPAQPERRAGVTPRRSQRPLPEPAPPTSMAPQPTPAPAPDLDTLLDRRN